MIPQPAATCGRFFLLSVAGDDRRGLFGVMTAARCAVLLLQRRGGVDAAAVVSCSVAAAAFICRGRVRYCFPHARAGAPAGVGIDCRRRRLSSLACLVYFRRFRLFSPIAQNFDRLCAPVRDLNDLAYALLYRDLPRFPAVACCSIPPCFPPCRPPCCSRRADAGDCRRRAALRMAAGVVRGDFGSVMMMIAGVAVVMTAAAAVVIVAAFRSVSVAGDDRRGVFGMMTAARCAVLLLQRRGGVDAAAVVSCSVAAAAFSRRGDDRRAVLPRPRLVLFYDRRESIGSRARFVCIV